MQQLSIDLESPPEGSPRVFIALKIKRQFIKSDYLNPEGVKKITDELGKYYSVKEVDGLLKQSIHSIVSYHNDSKSSHIPNAVAALLSAHIKSNYSGDDSISCRIISNVYMRQIDIKDNNKLQTDALIKTLKLAVLSSEQLETSCSAREYGEDGFRSVFVQIKVKDVLKKIGVTAKDILPNYTEPSGENADQKETNFLADNRDRKSRIQKIKGYDGEFEVNYEFDKDCAEDHVEATINSNIEIMARRKTLQRDLCSDVKSVSNINDKCNITLTVVRAMVPSNSNDQYQTELASLKELYEKLTEEELNRKKSLENPLAISN